MKVRLSKELQERMDYETRRSQDFTDQDFRRRAFLIAQEINQLIGCKDGIPAEGLDALAKN